MKAQIIEVTKWDIKHGKGNSNSCPIALAILRTVNRPFKVYQYMILEESVFIDYHVPRSVSRFVGRFDDGKKVEPFRFILRVK